MKRVIFLVLDSFGVGGAPDAEKFGDVGADTFGHIARECAEGHCDNAVRKGPLQIPNLEKLGLAEVAKLSTGSYPAGLGSLPPSEVIAAYGAGMEQSYGKDTPSGHWEMVGVPVLFDWGYFTDKQNAFPKELTDRILERAGLADTGYLGNCHASGTEILKELGEEHMETGKPIFYTSADSVFQIACHEESFGLERLYELCKIAREELDSYNIGRVIARPFTGKDASSFARTGNRHDYSVLPPAPTVLNSLEEAGGEVVSIGKISDIFAASGITAHHKATGLEELCNTTLDAIKRYTSKPTLIFTNLVDFDSSYGHRRDTTGYAAALEQFDRFLPQLLAALSDDDVLLLAADHGCDPTWQGTDHTRENIPILCYGKNVIAQNLGKRNSFADIGQSIASYLGLKACSAGQSFL